MNKILKIMLEVLKSQKGAFQVKKFDSIIASMVNWISSNTTKITDFNVGSVTRTILEAIAMELEELYYQLMKAVEEAIEEAIYRAFNFPKNPAEKATGLVRFFRLRGTEILVTITRLSNIATDSTPPVVFETQADSSITYINSYATGGSSISLVDKTRNWVTEGVVLGSKVKNVTDGGETQSAGVTSISPSDTLNFSSLTGGADFTINETTLDRVYYSDGSTGVVTPYTTQATLIDSVYFPIGLVKTEDYIYAGSPSKFFSFKFNKGAGAAQIIAANLVLEYWNGATWVSVQSLVDNTAGAVAPFTPFSVNANIEWTLPVDWAMCTYQTYNLYWIRISTNTSLTAGAQGDQLLLRRGDEYKVIAPYRDVAVQANEAGISGNVKAASITVLRTSIPNIESVSNIAAFSDGSEEETDLERKARFTLYIQSLARATRGALEYAARTVEQIVAAKAVDDVRATVLKQVIGPPAIWTDITESMRIPGDAPVLLFELSEALNDALYFGASELFDYINIHLDPAGTVAANQLLWEYYSATGWKTLPGMPAGDGTDSGTGPLTKDGALSFTPPNDWIATTIPTVGVTTFAYNRLWVRLRITGGGVTYSIEPAGDFCSLPPGFGCVFLYCHDGSGTLSSTLQISVENAVEPYRGCGIIVDVKAPNLITPTITVTLLVASNYDAADIAVKVKQALIDYLNTKVLGEDLYVAELYQFIMDKYDKAIVNAALSSPIQDIIVPSSEVIRPNDLLITVTGVTV